VRLDKLRATISAILIGGHFSVCFFVLFSWLIRDWIDSTDATLFFAIAVPALSPYTIAAFRDGMRRAKEERPKDSESRLVRGAALMVAAPLCFFVVLMLVIIGKLFLGFFAGIESYAGALLLGETLFGVYTGMVVETLFAC
jgi:hypothetical protein